MLANDFVISVPQIARICTVTGESVRQWCRSGWLKACKIDKRQDWIITFGNLAEHLEATPKHYEMLLNSTPERLRDQKLKRDLVQQIKNLRRQNQ